MAAWRSCQSLKVSLLTLILSLAVFGAVLVGGRLTDTVRAADPGLLGSAKQVSSTTAIPGQTLTYTIMLTNTGITAASALLTDTLPASLAYEAGSAINGAVYVSDTKAITWTGIVPAGGSASISYRGIVSSSLANGTLITNTAVISDGTNPLFSLTPVTTTISLFPDLSASVKQVSNTSATPGQTITYTVVVSNTGNGPATARITDTLPVSVTYASGSASNGAIYSSSSRSITWNGTVAAGTSSSISYRAVITSPLDNGLIITNSATIDDGNGSVFETTPVTTTISSSPDLSTSAKTVKRPISSPGGTVNYSIVVSNTGSMNTAARVTDTLPLSLTYIANSLQSTMGTSVYDSGTGSILWAGPALVGVPVTVSYQAKTPDSAPSGTVITNSATVQGTGAFARETVPVTVTVASNPSRIGWTNLGLYGSMRGDIIIDPSSGTVYMVGGGATGVYRTVNGGEVWLPSLTASSCGRGLLDRASGAVYASCRSEANNGALWKTSDNGLTWSAVLNRTKVPAMKDGPTRAVANSGSALYVADGGGPGTTAGIWASTDGGENWTRKGPGQTGEVNAVAADASNPLVVYIATSANVFRSADGGGTWADITPAGGADFRVLETSPLTPTIVFAASGWNGGLKVYKSADSGQTWSIVWASTDTRDTPISMFIFHPTDPNWIYSELGESTDAGNTWHFVQWGGVNAIDPANPNIWYAHRAPGFRKSTDAGATWTSINTGLEEVTVRGLAENPRDPNNYLFASPSGFGTTLDNGANWSWPLDTSVLGQDDMGGEAVALEPTTAYLSGGDSILGRSTDSGRTWSTGNLRQVVQNDLTFSYRPGVSELSVVPGETGHVFASVRERPDGGHVPRGGVYESTDGGLTWVATGLRGVPVNSIAFGPTDGGTLVYAGVGDSWGQYSGSGGVYTSTTSNPSVWHQIGISTTAPVVHRVRVDPTNPLVAYAGGNFLNVRRTALYKTVDGGATWRDIVPVLQGEAPVAGVNALAVDPVFPANVFASLERTIYQTVDGGTNWTVFSDVDLGSEGVRAMVVPLSAPSPVVTFTATIGGSQAVVRWTNPSDSDLAGVLIKYSTLGFPMVSTEGITLTTSVASAPSVYTQTDVISGTTYYYSAFAYNQAGRYSLPYKVAANSATVGLSTDAAELSLRSASALPRRPAAQATSSRNIYAASGAGLFAKSIGTTGSGQKIYVPFLARQFAPGW